MFESPTLQTLTDYNIWVAMPAIMLAFGTMFLLVIDVLLPEERKHWTPILALCGVVASFIATLLTYSPEQSTTFGGMFIADPFTGFLNIVVLLTVFIGILLSTDYLHRTHTEHGEYYILLLMSATGAMFMVGANDLIIIFIGLELLSIPLYVLAAFRVTYIEDRDALSVLKSEEGGVKYFILGAFSSAFLVYGSALIYGATGTTNLQEIFAAVGPILDTATQNSGALLLLVGTGLALVGLGFKVGAVPFHMWTPDVYEGAPTPITAYMSVAAKVGGFAALLRLLVVGLSGFSLEAGVDPATWQSAVQVIAILTLIIGNFVALSQTNVKRLLAYSSIAHAGYILTAVAAVGSAGLVNGVVTAAVQGVLVYLLAYAFTNLGAFGVVLAIENDDGTGTDLDDFNGLFNSRPLLATAMAIFMFSLAGIPLTAGFVGKWLVFSAAVQAGLIPLAIIGVLTSVVSAFYYVRVIVNMFLKTEDAGAPAVGESTGVRYAIYASMAGVLILGIAVPLVTNLVSMVHLI